VGGQGGICPRRFRNFIKKIVFLVSSGKNPISPLFSPPWKNLGKIPWWSPPGKNPSDAHGSIINKLAMGKSIKYNIKQ